MVIRISPQWQVTIPRAYRPQLGSTGQLEAQLEEGALVLRPVLAPSAEWAERHFMPEGITREVLWEAMRLIESRRKTRP